MLYHVQIGDTLTDIAGRVGTTVQTLVDINGIVDPNLIFVGQVLITPSASYLKSNQTFGGRQQLPLSTRYPGCVGPTVPRIQGYPQARTRKMYDEVIDQFAVETNPRYAPTTLSTQCNVFVWDVTRAMSAEIPHVLTKTIDARASTEEYVWLTANSMGTWLEGQGSLHGWRRVVADDAQRFANLGHPTIASLFQSPIGHIGIVRPGEMLNGPALAQAGRHNHSHAFVYDHFPKRGTRFFVNDSGRSRN